MMMTRAVVPTLFTVLNMFCGFLSIIHSSDGKYVEAGYFILLAAVFDSLDGLMARLTRSASQFGVEIDSLSDVVSFGAAPSYLVYALSLHRLAEWGIIISSLQMVLGGIRLARFNVQLVGFEKDHFTGLPIPAAALTLVAFVLTFVTPDGALTGLPETLLPALVVVVALVMVSTVRYDTFPKLNAKEVKKHPVKMISYFFAALLLIFTKGAAVFYLMSAFVLIGIVQHAARWLRSGGKREEEAEEAPGYDV